jgi:hypothetical protein
MMMMMMLMIIIIICQDTLITVLWNQQVTTYITIQCNKSNIILADRRGTRLLVDVCTPSDKNLLKIEVEINIKIQGSTD